MPGKTISQIYNHSEAQFTRRLREAKQLNEQRVHKLRVDIKNLRVLLDLLQVVSHKKKAGKAVLKQVDPVFRKAGKIRTAYCRAQPYTKPALPVEGTAQIPPAIAASAAAGKDRLP
jgi:hypothetical protein